LIDTLTWFSDLPVLPSSLKAHFKNGQCGLGEWFAATIEDLDLEMLPKEVKEFLQEKKGTFGYTQVNWRNLVMDPAFATFIARLFQNSFSSEVVKQNFRLTHDFKKDNLIKLIRRHVGKQQLDDIIDFQGLTVFNATSICSNLLLSLSEAWTYAAKSKEIFKVPAYVRAYKEIVQKIAQRRTDVDIFDSYKISAYKTAKERRAVKKMLDKTDSPLYRMPLQPQNLYTSDRSKVTHKHVMAKLQNITSLHIKAITRSSISTQSRFTRLNKDKRNSNMLKSIQWDTLAPKKKN
jgi:hypothetical protein